MHAPGVEARPLRQMTGGASFNEVFFTEVRVPDSHRLGDVNGGWTVALTTLMNERAAIGGGSIGERRRLRQRASLRAGHATRARTTIRLIRQQLATIYIAGRVANVHEPPGNGEDRRRRASGPRDVDRQALAHCQHAPDLATCSRRCSARSSIADSGEWGTYAWSQYVLGIPGMRIAGGTDEVLRNIVSERVLGMPKDPSRPGAMEN